MTGEVGPESVQPISPAEITKAKVEQLPGEVITAFNMLITETWADGEARVKQADVVKLLEEKGLDRSEIFDKGWLNVEGVYKKAGWKVEYDKPAYNEDYPATFTFRAPK